MMQTCWKITVHVVNTDNVKGLHKKVDLSMCTVTDKIVTKHDSKNTQVSMSSWLNIRVALDFAGMLIVACKQHTYVDTWDAKKLWLNSGDIEMKTHKI